jgi:transposase
MRTDYQINAYHGNQISGVKQLFHASPLFLPLDIMVSTKLEAQRKTVLHYWMNGTRSPKEIHAKTKIPLRTINRNIKKIKETGTVEHRRGNGRRTKVTQKVAAAIGQHVRRDNAISTRQLAVKVEETQGVSISHQAVWMSLKKKDTRARSLGVHQCSLTNTSKHG